jgi:hypothetical protein
MEEEDTKASFPPSRYRFERRLRSLVRASEGTRETDLGAIAGRTRAPAGVSVLRDETQYRTGTGRRGTAVRVRGRRLCTNRGPRAAAVCVVSLAAVAVPVEERFWQRRGTCRGYDWTSHADGHMGEARWQRAFGRRAS